MKKLFLLTLFSIALSSSLLAQFSEGCLSNLEFWYNTTSSSNVLKTGVNVTGWSDAQTVDGSNTYNLISTGLANSELPAYITEDINGYDVVSFGSDDYLYATNVVGTDFRQAQAFTLYFVIKTDGGNNSIFTHSDGTNRTNFHSDKFYWGTGLQSPKTSRTLDYSSNKIGTRYEVRSVAVGIDFYQPVPDSTVILRTKYSVYKNGAQISTKTSWSESVGSATDSFILGAYKSLDLQGSIAEIMIFKDGQDLLPAKQTRIHSYLSLKYGISQEGSLPTYTDNDGRDVFPYSTQCGSEDAFSTFDSRVTGIFRDVYCYNIHHNKSTNYDGEILTGALTDNGGTFSNPNNFQLNRMYFLWGDDDNTITFNTDGNTSDVPTGSGLKRMERRWKVYESEKSSYGGAKSNTIGDVTYEFDLSTSDIPSDIAIGDIYILVDTDHDGSFTDETGFNPDSWNPTTKIGQFERDFDDCEIFTFAITETELPVTWAGFNAYKVNNSVVLDWSTAMEINNSHFEIERSLDGVNWFSIGEISGQGDYSDITEYSFIDNEPVEGVNYYRIKQVDFDGKYSYTRIESVVFSHNLLVSSMVYPNPADEFVTIDIPFNGSNVSYSLVDLAGNILKNGTFNTDKHNLSVVDLKEGLYMLKLQSGATSQIHQIMIH
ncbi:MAG: T9SS type A sorting domain-containing protein [Bacteroidia bacterium]